MKLVNEMRERQAWEQPKTSSPIPIVLGALIAFGIGVLGVSGLVKTPTLLQPKQKAVAVSVDATAAPAPAAAVVAEKSSIAVDTGGNRVGHAREAPLLRSCMQTGKYGIPSATGFTSADLYGILQQASLGSRLAVANGTPAAGSAHFASTWGEIADCIYRQNGYMLCNPDNRALAIEATTTFLREYNSAVKQTPSDKASPKQKQNIAYAIQNATSMKDRIFSGMKNRIAEGRFVASDFGFFAPSEITQLVRDTRVTSDACAAGR